MNASKVIATLILCLLVSPHISAAPSDLQLDNEARREVVLDLAGLIEKKYIEAETAVRLAHELRQRLAAGAYDAYDSRRDLAGVLTRELVETDRHFFIDWQPPGSGVALVGDHSEESEEHWREYSRLQNFGFRRVDILPGNIGYLELCYFDSPRPAADTAMAAMNLLANTDAVIVDLRRNGGGEPEMVQLLASYFLGPEPVHYNSFHSRDGETTRQFWTLPHVRGKRILEAPLYVLTSARTGSAAEGFSYALQTQKRATIVGEITGGAANPGEGFAIGHGFSAFVSTGKPVNPVTGTNWEGTGVQPDTRVDSSYALDVAYADALRHLLAERTNETTRRGLEWALEALEVEDPPSKLPLPELQQLAGQYGNRRIRIEGDHLTYQRGRRTVHRMVPLGNDRFLLANVDGFRITFERDPSGRVVRMLDQWDDGHVAANLPSGDRTPNTEN
jgi:hypothetical protein